MCQERYLITIYYLNILYIAHLLYIIYILITACVSVCRCCYLSWDLYLGSRVEKRPTPLSFWPCPHWSLSAGLPNILPATSNFLLTPLEKTLPQTPLLSVSVGDGLSFFAWEAAGRLAFRGPLWAIPDLCALPGVLAEMVRLENMQSSMAHMSECWLVLPLGALWRLD